MVRHAQLLDMLLRDGRLSLAGATHEERVGYHNSYCLGRHNDVYLVPRRVVGSLVGIDLPHPAKKAAKKRRPMSPETRANLAKNLVKARAARAAKQKKASRTTKSVATGKKRVAAKKR